MLKKNSIKIPQTMYLKHKAPFFLKGLIPVKCYTRGGGRSSTQFSKLQFYVRENVILDRKCPVLLLGGIVDETLKNSGTEYNFVLILCCEKQKKMAFRAE